MQGGGSEGGAAPRLKLGSLRPILGPANPLGGAGGGIAIRHTSDEDTTRETDDASLAEAPASGFLRKEGWAAQQVQHSTVGRVVWLGACLASLGALLCRHHDRNGRFGTVAVPPLALLSFSLNAATNDGRPTS